MTGNGNIRSIERACDVLYCIFNDINSITEIGKALGLNKSTVHRILLTLESKGMVFRNKNKHFEIGLGLAKAIARNFNSYKSLVDAARPSLMRLNALTKETIVLHVNKGSERMCIFEALSPHPLRYNAGVGECVPIYIGAAGFVLLAFSDDDSIKVILDNIEIKPLTSKTIISKEEILKRLNDVRNEGYSISFGERLDGTTCLSRPIFNYSGIAAAVSILGPVERFSGENVYEYYLSELKKESSIISEKIGCKNYQNILQSYKACKININ